MPGEQKTAIRAWTAGIASPTTPLSSSNRLPSLLAPRLLSSRSIGREIRAGDQPSRSHGPIFLRLHVARGGTRQKGQIGLRRLST